MILDLFRKEIAFHNIHGYDDIKNIVRRALDTEDSYNLLFVGPPASAKTPFLLGILECRKSIYFDGSNTTNRILSVLEENRPKIICIDELDKMPRQFQEKLLNFMEGGHIKVDQMRKQYDFTIKGAKGVSDEYSINDKIASESQQKSTEDIQSTKTSTDTFEKLFDESKLNNFLYSCHYCASFQTNYKDDYESHVVLNHSGSLSYPEIAYLEKLGIQPKGKSWEAYGS